MCEMRLNVIGREYRINSTCADEIIITAGGKNIAPKNIESALRDLPLISQAVVIGDKRKFLSALLTLDPDVAQKFAGEQSIPFDQIHENRTLIEEVQKGVHKVNEAFARVEHVRKFKILSRDFGVDEGELTPTLKIKRRVINKIWSAEIESMYEE